MRKLMLAFFCLLIVTPYCLRSSPSKTQTQFISLMEKNTYAIDQSIAEERAHLLELYQKVHAGKNLHLWEKSWLQSLAKEYEIRQPSFEPHSKTWKTLLSRVDIIPPSLVIAQAIHESDWGRSRFAMEGNNYFGQHCNIAGCGMIPNRRPPGAIFEVQKFQSPLESVRSYIHMLNTKNAYALLRELRANLQSERKQIHGIILANGLKYYSEQDTYVQNIKKLILKYQLIEYDDIVAPSVASS